MSLQDVTGETCKITFRKKILKEKNQANDFIEPNTNSKFQNADIFNGEQINSKSKLAKIKEQIRRIYIQRVKEISKKEEANAKPKIRSMNI